MQRSAAAAPFTSLSSASRPSFSPALISQAGRLSCSTGGITGLDTGGRSILLPSANTKLGSPKAMERILCGALIGCPLIVFLAQPDFAHAAVPSGSAQSSFNADRAASLDNTQLWLGSTTAR